MRIPALPIMLALAVAGAIPTVARAGTPGTTTSTTVSTSSSTSSTTTTTLACTKEVTFPSVLCRLNVLSDRVNAATDLGRLKNGLVDAVQNATENTQTASSSSGKKANKQLKHAIRRMIGFVHRLGSHSGKKVISAPTRSELRAAGSDVLDDMQALFKSL